MAADDSLYIRDRYFAARQANFRGLRDELGRLIVRLITEEQVLGGEYSNLLSQIITPSQLLAVMQFYAKIEPEHKRNEELKRALIARVGHTLPESLLPLIHDEKEYSRLAQAFRGYYKKELRYNLPGDDAYDEEYIEGIEFPPFAKNQPPQKSV